MDVHQISKISLRIWTRFVVFLVLIREKNKKHGLVPGLKIIELTQRQSQDKGVPILISCQWVVTHEWMKFRNESILSRVSFLTKIYKNIKNIFKKPIAQQSERN